MRSALGMHTISNLWLRYPFEVMFAEIVNIKITSHQLKGLFGNYYFTGIG